MRRRCKLAKEQQCHTAGIMKYCGIHCKPLPFFLLNLATVHVTVLHSRARCQNYLSASVITFEWFSIHHQCCSFKAGTTLHFWPFQPCFVKVNGFRSFHKLRPNFYLLFNYLHTCFQLQGSNIDTNLWALACKQMTTVQK